MFVRSSSLANGQQTFKIKPVNIQSRSARTLIKRTSADMELSIYLKPYIYLYSYKTETAFFLTTKHEKTIMAVISIVINISFGLNFWPASNTIKIKQGKNSEIHLQ